MTSLIKILSVAAACALLLCSGAEAQPNAGRPPAVIPIDAEPPPRLVAYAPLPEALARGVAIVQFRTEHLRVMPVFGEKALPVSPRIGHLHVTVDDRPGTWAHTSGDPIIVVGLPPGRHTLLLEIADPSHRILVSERVVFTIPEAKASSPKPHSH